jgi:hypothetical protein
MNKKIVTAILIGASGIAIYLLSKSIREKRKRPGQQRAGDWKAKPNSGYAYEYTL